MSNMWSGDMEDGIAFTFKMIMIGVMIAVGVCVALIPKYSWIRAMRNTLCECCCGRSERRKYFPLGEVREGRIKMLSSTPNRRGEREGPRQKKSTTGGGGRSGAKCSKK